jgi:hypothetical protein
MTAMRKKYARGLKIYLFLVIFCSTLFLGFNLWAQTEVTQPVTSFCTLAEILSSTNFDQRAVSCAAGYHIEGNDCVSNFRPDNTAWIGSVFSGFWASSTLISNAAPVVTDIWVTQQPTALGYYIYPTILTINASAYDPDGQITAIDFYYTEGTSSDLYYLGTDISAPYTLDWTDMYLGTYHIYARAIDDNGATALSNSVEVTVRLNAPPNVVAIDTPLSNETKTEPYVNITAHAADQDGMIAKIEIWQKLETELFYKKIPSCVMEATVLAPSFSQSCIWERVGPGTYNLKAIATDDHAGTAESVPITVIVDLPDDFLNIVARKADGTQFRESFGPGQDIAIEIHVVPAVQRLQLSNLVLKFTPSELPDQTIYSGTPITVQTWSEAEIFSNTSTPYTTFTYVWREALPGVYTFTAEGTAFWNANQKFTKDVEIAVTPEICEDGIDNDADGTQDNGCAPITFTVNSIWPGNTDDIYVAHYKLFDQEDNFYQAINSPSDPDKHIIRPDHHTFTHKFMPGNYTFKLEYISSQYASPGNLYPFGAANISIQGHTGQSTLSINSIAGYNTPTWGGPVTCTEVAANGSYNCEEIRIPECNVPYAVSCGGTSQNTETPGAYIIAATITGTVATGPAANVPRIEITSPYNGEAISAFIGPIDVTVRTVAIISDQNFTKIAYYFNGSLRSACGGYTCTLGASWGYAPFKVTALAYTGASPNFILADSDAIAFYVLHHGYSIAPFVAMIKPTEESVLKRNSFKEISAMAFTPATSTIDHIEFWLDDDGPDPEKQICIAQGVNYCYWQISDEADTYSLTAKLFLTGATTAADTDSVTFTIEE